MLNSVWLFYWALTMKLTKYAIQGGIRFSLQYKKVIAEIQIDTTDRDQIAIAIWECRKSLRESYMTILEDAFEAVTHNASQERH
jgi:hypothetical protein